MTGAAFILPDRPLKVSPPGKSGFSDFGSVLLSLFLAGACAFVVIYPLPALIDDWGIRETAQPVPEAKLEKGSCSSRIMTMCDATLVNGSVRREEHYFFVDIHFGSYTAGVMADPAKPEILTTDLALDKLTNRLITMAIGGPLFLLLGIASLWHMAKRLKHNDALRKALSNQKLRTVPLRLDGVSRKNQWVTSHTRPDGKVTTERWPAGRKRWPIKLGTPGQILGVTAGDGRYAMPLDGDLKWLKLSKEERNQLLASFRQTP